MYECAVSRFRTMYLSFRGGIEVAAMDGSQHDNLVNTSQSYISGLTIDAEGWFYHVVTSGEQSAMETYFNDLFYYSTVTSHSILGKGGHEIEWEGDRKVRRRARWEFTWAVLHFNSQNCNICFVEVPMFVKHVTKIAFVNVRHRLLHFVRRRSGSMQIQFVKLLCLYYVGQRVYWCDGRRIESVAYDGSNRIELVYNANWIFNGITLVGEKLYYTDRR